MWHYGPGRWEAGIKGRSIVHWIIVFFNTLAVHPCYVDMSGFVEGSDFGGEKTRLTVDEEKDSVWHGWLVHPRGIGCLERWEIALHL